jgi:hypothetical protein
LAAAALASAVVVSACGGEDGDEPAPKGPPAARVGEASIRTYQDVERIRARLVATSDLFFLRQSGGAQVQLAAARRGYDELTGLVRTEDAVLDREIQAAFPLIEQLIGRGTTFDAVRDRLSPLLDQLLGGAAAALVPAEARNDRGLQAEVLSRLLDDFVTQFSRAAGPYGAEAERALEYSYGLLARAQSVGRGLSESLGPQKDDVTEGIAGIREGSFPENMFHPTPKPVAQVTGEVEEVKAALAKRFELR